ncbi:acetyl-CoA hydrolase/transferase family protein [Roseivirga echinicomitans]|uniref:4-hydroxybutyrate CoA-transferase n=1 Tax=Roseivirga echinicomitans TaxID=296218 RepID=A0A150X9N8_9BACT|nr:acetyl-CoA hydrolase/transferase C-terminal domain-containing protein [Roseivirga echinicomitans]KYG75406.1 4-hydroxybutyrate CoA-transferase [Roseivirga echinicomitans]
MEYTTAEKAVELIKSGDKVFIHTAAATPQDLVQAMTDRAYALKGVEIFHLHTEGIAPYTRKELSRSFHTNSLFVGGNCRDAIAEGQADFIPCFLSEVPIMFRRGVIPLDVALIQVSPPDAHGFTSLGVSVDASLAAAESAKTIIAQVNPNMPRTHGDGMIHMRNFDAMVWSEEPIYEAKAHHLSDDEVKMGGYIAEMIEDGSTLQMGIGSIPDAVLAALGNHKDLGVHTEMFSDGVIPLMKSGVINNKFKKKHPYALVSGFMIGSKELYDFVDDNPSIRMLDIEYVNDTRVIRQNPKVISINSAIEVDLTGQVCADSIGTKIYSGVGGQMDFIRGASLSEGGKPIIALSSVTSKGESKIASFLKPGAGVVTTRAHVHYIVTEYGVANLYGKSLRQRAKALIDIAHPDHRERLEREAFTRFVHF